MSLGLRVQGGAVCKRPSAEGTVPAFVCVEEKGGGVQECGRDMFAGVLLGA